MQPSREKDNSAWPSGRTQLAIKQAHKQWTALVLQYVTSFLALCLHSRASLRVFPCWNDGHCVSLTASGPTEKPAIYMLISTTAHWQSADGTSLIPARVEGQQRGFCVICALHYRKWCRIFIPDDPQKNPAVDQYIALYNPSEWLEFLVQDSHLTALARGRFL